MCAWLASDIRGDVEFVTTVSKVGFGALFVKLETVDAKVAIGLVAVSESGGLGGISGEEVEISVVAVKDAE